MTAQEIADRLTHPDHEITALRILKTQKLCDRSAVTFEEVLACLTDAERQQIQELTT